MLSQPTESQTLHGGLVERAGDTLKIMHRWGYAPRIEVLSELLLGGSASAEHLHHEIETRSNLVVQDGFVSLRGYSHLIRKARRRVDSNHSFRGEAVAIARAFARDLARSCPMVDCIALSGSLASGGYAPEDDIDFDLIVQPGTKYLCYLVAHLVGLRFSWRYRHLQLDELHHTPFLPKIACINVVWPEDQAKPFVRRDENMAFELMRCTPLIGVEAFELALRANPWIRDYFPQVYDRVWTEPTREPANLLGWILAAVGRSPRMLQFVEAASRRIVSALYHYVQHSRRGNEAAVARMEFLRKVKFPYEVFQD